MKIAIVGAGYVGLSIAVLLASQHDVVVLDISSERVQQINSGKSTVADSEIEAYLASKPLNLQAVTDKNSAYEGADFVIVATPTDYDPANDLFDTRSVEAVISDVMRINPAAVIVVKSTVPVGFTRRMQTELGCQQVLFSPEFLREGRALWDNLYPSRIVVGGRSERARRFGEMMKAACLKPDVPLVYTGSSEAEAIKLFANTFLAMRVAFFNELDSYAATHGLDTRQIIDGVSLDPRIGNHYNNPSFGYGGYCLPKDTRQLLANYDQVPQSLIRAVVEANSTRMDFVASDILKRKPQRVGIYRLVMKSGSDNLRSSSVQGIMQRLQAKGVDLVVYEPLIGEGGFMGAPVMKDLEAFKHSADLIVANRQAGDLADVAHKVYTRDVFGQD